MSRFKDITGQKFGRLTVLYKLNNYHKKGVWWLCVCDCGNLTKVRGNRLRSLEIKSCGCYRNERIIEVNTKHGKYGTRLYRVWNNMKDRCYNEQYHNYPNYGGRGIAVCSEWRNDFQAFYKWAVDNGYRDNLTIDRTNVDGNYEPSNCRWVTMKQQNRNKTNNNYITINGITHCLSEWCEIYNINYKRVWDRLKKGWTVERALEL